MTAPLWQKVKRNSLESLDEGERGEWKSWSKTHHSENKDHGTRFHCFMANGEKMETLTNFIFLGSKITADGDCSHEIKRCLLFVVQVMTNLDSILKSRDITLPTTVCLVSYGSSGSHVFMWESDYNESWALKNWCFLKHQLSEALKKSSKQGDNWSVVLEKTLESPLNCKEINQSILQEINSDYSLERLTLKLQYFGTWCKELTH